MNSLERNSATFYNKEKEKYNNRLKEIKLKKWQNPNYKELIRLKEEKKSEDFKKRVEAVKRKEEEELKKRVEELKNREEIKRRVEVKNQNQNQNQIVKYDVNQNNKIDLVKQRMFYIQYLLNTFEMYPEFDIHYYRNNNDDIKHLNNYELVYHWNHIGVNERNKRIYNNETFMALNPNFYKDYPIYIFMHVCNLHNGIEIFYDQLKSIIDCGLYDKCKNILVCIVGKNFELPTDKYNKLILLYQDDNPKYYEVKSINYIKYVCDKIDEKSRILYIHTKGVRKNGDEVCVKSWRKLLEYYTVINHDIALQYLINYDTVGSNVINMSPSKHSSQQYLYYVNPNHYFHYSGNFWWATAKHIRRLPMLMHNPKSKDAISTRCRAENWILSPLPYMRGFEMYYNKNYVHPYNTYCEPNSYKKKYIEIFSGRNNFEILKETKE